jgi:segregation and condensation protein B
MSVEDSGPLVPETWDSMSLEAQAELAARQSDEPGEPQVVEGESAPAADDSPPPPPLRIVEALLFVGGEPLTGERAGQIIRGFTADQFAQAIATLDRDYRRQGRPYVILSQGDGREARLSPAAIDVLALLAYRQPATKTEIDGIRGAESGSLLRQLVRRGLAAVLHRADSAQKEVTYGTTPRFLEMFGLSSLDDLPRTQDLQLI